MQSGYPNENLFPKRGPSVNYTLNGIARMIRGDSGEPAKITKNGKETTLTAEIKKNDYIDIVESTTGMPVEMKLEELNEYNSSVTFVVNGMNITCPKFAYVNGEIKTGSYIIREGDIIIMEDYYSVEQLFGFMDISTEGKRIIVNNETADNNTKVYPNFTVKYEDADISYNDLPEPEPETEAAPVDEPVNTSSTGLITIKVNGSPVTLTGKTSYTFVDILDFYPFDMSTMGGDELIMTADGVKADFITPIHDGSEISLYWKYFYIFDLIFLILYSLYYLLCLC